MMEYHIPVLLKESLDALQICPDGIYIDATFGAGGHSKPILKQLSAKGHLYGFDQDVDVEENLLEKENFTFIRSNFRHMHRFMRLYQQESVDGILMDLGVSSHQINMPERGFSYRYDASLDMRMNQSAEFSAADLVNGYDKKELQQVLSRYGEVRNARTLADRVVKIRSHRSIETTFQLNEILDQVSIGSKVKYYSQVYQALRMEVNDEMGALEEALEGGLKCLNEGGRMVVISYHSLEDRLVKRFFKAGNVEGVLNKNEYGHILKSIKQINKKLVLPSEEELKRNNRARSAKMRIGEKV
ncbi:MAG: 16S rRNA (cytosine(1402)-N(4))-methyltransferase RsmH [Saprospiraceae bacterium]|nr:16S rRNA (cytosine(1402)-N(4))-methyltransferase RsmH [Saprospiraceae bacterium]